VFVSPIWDPSSIVEGEREHPSSELFLTVAGSLGNKWAALLDLILTGNNNLQGGVPRL
jgi:hypothetical protein